MVLKIFEDFLLLYPELEVTLKHLKKEYKSNVSKVIWAMIMDFHPKSLYKNLDQSARRSILSNEYLSFQLDWKKHEVDIDTLKKFFLTKPEQYLVAWEQKLDERQQFIASKPYDSSTYEMLDKMMSNTDKMWKQYMVCLKDVEDEEATTLGGSQESLSEQGVI